MYKICTVKDTIRVPPKALGGNLNEIIRDSAKDDFQGLIDDDLGLVVSVLDARKQSEGKVIPGDGMIYYDSEIDMLVYKPEIHEVVEGIVSEVTEFGVFIRTGPIEGLIHRSQIMDDYVNYDQKNQVFIGKETKKKIGVNDQVLARTVSVSLKGSITNSKIGYTMRQLGLGKKEWLKADEKRKKAKEKGKPKDNKKESKK